MNVCEKCKGEIKTLVDELDVILITVPESDCEFWAHKELNRLADPDGHGGYIQK